MPHNTTLLKYAAIPLCAVLLATPAYAKPISYVGGVMVMQENDETGHTVFLDYTLSSRLAVGWYDKWEKNERNGDNFSVHGPQVNTLIKRWNLAEGQGNIFNSTGAGIALNDGRNRSAAWTSFMGDYETRQIFISYEMKGFAADSMSNSFSQKARVGYAPYPANYDDIATWFMVQLDHHPAKADTWVATPLVRLFYKTTLIEAGYSSNDRIMFNWYLQF